MIVKNVEKKEKNTAAFQVETDAAEFEAAVNGAYLKNKSSIYIPGFRKGKAPRAVVEGMYGAEVFYQDAMDELAPKAFELGLKESGLRIVGAPAISDVNVTENLTVAYTFEVTLYPEVTLGQYKGLSAAKDSVNVTDEDVEKALQDALKRNARILTVDDREAQMGDTANIDFDGFLDGERFDGGKAEDYDLELGSGAFVPGFEEQVVGMKIGEEKDVNITFPEDYVADLAGKAVVFKVKLNSLSAKELPALDDEFAKDVSEFDTLEEYKADIRAKQEEQQREQAENKFRSDIMRQACDNMTVEIPEVMIEEKLEEIVRNYAANFGFTDRNTSLQDLLNMMGVDAAAIRPSAEMQVKTDLLLDAVAEAENAEITEEETEEYLKRVAEGIGAKPEDIKNYFSKEFIEAEMKKERATNAIIESAAEREKPLPGDGLQHIGIPPVRQAEVDEAGAGHLHRGKPGICQIGVGDQGLGDLPGGHVQGLGPGHGVVGGKVTVGAVLGDLHGAAEGGAGGELSLLGGLLIGGVQNLTDAVFGVLYHVRHGTALLSCFVL